MKIITDVDGKRWRVDKRIRVQPGYVQFNVSDPEQPQRNQRALTMPDWLAHAALTDQVRVLVRSA